MASEGSGPPSSHITKTALRQPSPRLFWNYRQEIETSLNRVSRNKSRPGNGKQQLHVQHEQSHARVHTGPVTHELGASASCSPAEL